jgi:pyruvate dehydrogenase E2 component (dihydrolipoamide acetyltransferase)
MPTEIRLPQAGMGMTDGTVLEWLKNVGDQVRTGECIAEVEAAKTTVEIEAPCDGVLAQILAPEGTVVPVREVLAVIIRLGEPAQVPAPEPEAPVLAGSAVAAVPAAPAGVPQQVVPAARRLAAKHGVALTEVTGSGPGGRITEADVRAHLAAREADGPARAAGAMSAAREAERPAIALGGTRGLIARRMVGSLRDSAQYTLIRGIDVTALVDRHDRGQFPGGVTYTDLIARAVVLTLADHPRLNAHVADGSIQPVAAIHLGFAVDAGEALLVGVVRDAGSISLVDLAATRRALTERILAGTAGPAELAGSTFTISNLGGAGIDAFTPIINPPEVAILGVGAIIDQPVKVEGGGIGWRKSLTLSLTVDHRAVDGAPAARFLGSVAGCLADPGLLTATR